MPLPLDIICIPSIQGPNTTFNPHKNIYNKPSVANESLGFDPAANQCSEVIVGVKLSLEQLQATVSIVQNIFINLIKECELTRNRISDASDRYQALKEASNALLLGESMNVNISSSNSSSEQKTNATFKSNSRKSRKRNITIDVFDKRNLPAGIQQTYHNNKVNNPSIELLSTMDTYITLLPRKYNKLRSHVLLYSDANFFFQYWQQQQLEKLKEQKVAYKRKKYDKEQIDYIRQMRSDGPRPAVESVVSIASRRGLALPPVTPGKASSTMSTSVKDHDILSQIKPTKEDKAIVEISWKDRYMVKGQPVHVNQRHTRTALHNYYTSYIHIAQRRSELHIDRLLDEDSDNDDDYVPSEDTSDSMSLSSLSLSSSTSITPKAIISIQQPISTSSMNNHSPMANRSFDLNPIKLQPLPEDDVDEDISGKHDVADADAVSESSSAGYATPSSQANASQEGRFNFILPSHGVVPPPPPRRTNDDAGMSTTPAISTASIIPPPLSQSLSSTVTTPPPPPPPAPLRHANPPIPNPDNKQAPLSIAELADITRVSMEDVLLLPVLDIPSSRLSIPRLSGNHTPTGKSLRSSMRFTEHQQHHSIIPPPPPPPSLAMRSLLPPAMPEQLSTPSATTKAPMSLLDAIRSGESRLKKVTHTLSSASSLNMIENASMSSTASFMTASSTNNLTGIFHSAAVNAILARRRFISESSSDDDSGYDSDTIGKDSINKVAVDDKKRRQSARRRSLSSGPIVRSHDNGSSNNDDEDDAEDWI